MHSATISRRDLRSFLSLAVPLAAATTLSIPSASLAQVQPVSAPPQTVTTPLDANPLGMSDGLQQTLLAMMADKNTWTAAQRKVDSHLIYAARIARGQQPVPGVAILPTYVALDSKGRVPVEIHAAVTDRLLKAITAAGGEVTGSYPAVNSVQATVPLLDIESIGALTEVMYIRRVLGAIDNRRAVLGSNGAAKLAKRPLFPYRRPSKAELRSRVEKALIGSGAIAPHSFASLAPLFVTTGSVDSEGDTTHNAILARSTYNVSGAGLKIGVLSNGDAHLAQSIATGDLPSNVTVAVDVFGNRQDGPAGNDGEGTAIMEIIHDLAPNAQLFFATAFNGESSFASNILQLRNTYHCDIICDDVLYLDESPFEDGPIAQSVNQVTAGGGLYFSSANNQGQLGLDGSQHNASVYESDFHSSGVTISSPSTPSGTLNGEAHNFGTAAAPVLYETATGNMIDSSDYNGNAAGNAVLFWADPMYAGTNEYDLYSTSSDGNTIDDYSNYPAGEGSYQSAFVHSAGNRIYVIRTGSSAKVALHLNGYGNAGGPAMSFVTNGQTHGHNSAADAFCVAATPANAAYPGQFNSTDTVEFFSNDGPRRVFFNSDDSPITAGNYLFATGGGTLRLKPDITAADGVSTSMGGFSPFYGTSAASPHAAAIGALVKSYVAASDSSIPGLTINGPLLAVSEMRAALINSAIDIGPVGFDDLSGNGIVMPIPAIQYLRSFLPVGSITAATQTMNGANITWNTNLPASSTVNYGTTKSLGSTASGNSGVTVHSVNLTGLQSATLYYYKVVSATPTGSISYTDPSTALHTFATSSASAQAALAVTTFSASSSSGVVTFVVTIVNRGTIGASGVRVTAATLGGTATTTTLPLSAGTISAGGSTTVTLNFPSPGSGTVTTLKISGNDSANDTISFTGRMKVP